MAELDRSDENHLTKHFTVFQTNQLPQQLPTTGLANSRPIVYREDLSVIRIFYTSTPVITISTSDGEDGAGDIRLYSSTTGLRIDEMHELRSLPEDDLSAKSEEERVTASPSISRTQVRPFVG